MLEALPACIENIPPTVVADIVSSKIAEPPVAVVYILNLKLYVLSATVTPAEVVSLP